MFGSGTHLEPSGDPHRATVARTEVAAGETGDDRNQPRRDATVALLHPHPHGGCARWRYQRLQSKNKNKKTAKTAKTVALKTKRSIRHILYNTCTSIYLPFHYLDLSSTRERSQILGSPTTVGTAMIVSPSQVHMCHLFYFIYRSLDSAIPSLVACRRLCFAYAHTTVKNRTWQDSNQRPSGRR